MVFDSLSLLKAVFESIADGILIVSNDGKVIQYNSRFSEMWRIPQEVLETRDDKKLISVILSQLASPAAFMAKVTELYDRPEEISTDMIYFADGRCYERFTRPLKIGETIAGRVWSFRDVTAQKQNQEFFSTITELSPDIVSLVDESGKLIFNSKAAERIHGYGPDELVGRNTFDLVHPEDQATVSTVMESLLAQPGSIHAVQYRYRNRDGSWNWMEATASNQLQNPPVRALVTISREIGKRKKMEEELNRALKERDAFISIASHELKTPISSMKLQLQMLQRYKKTLRADDTAKSRSEDLNGLVDQIESLQRLIDDMLSVSRLRTGNLHMQFQREDFSTLVKTSLARSRDMFAEANCALEEDIEADLWLACDRTRMNQVFYNLMSNAVKYAPGAPVKVTLKRVGEMAQFTITDHGPGIPADMSDTIFGLFERGSSQKYVAGLGIGLYISRSIVEGHNGTIAVTSTPDHGSSFIVNLPLQ